MANLPKEYREGWAEENAIFRTARKSYRCHGNGVAPAPGCAGTIRPGDPYIEFVGETPAYQRGTAHCMTCAIAFEYIVPATEGAG
jgi:hypothetical protein